NEGGLGRAKVMQKLGIAQILGGDYERGEKTLRTSLAEWDAALQFRIRAGQSRLREYESEVEIIRWLQKALVESNRTDMALELAQKGRTRAYYALLSDRRGIVPRALEFDSSLNLAQVKNIAAETHSTLVEYSILYASDVNLPMEFSDY